MRHRQHTYKLCLVRPIAKHKTHVTWYTYVAYMLWLSSFASFLFFNFLIKKLNCSDVWLIEQLVPTLPTVVPIKVQISPSITHNILEREVNAHPGVYDWTLPHRLVTL